jgi:hypothetical protein
MPFGSLQQPGFYQPGQARMLNAGRQLFLWQNQRVLATQASVAVELERQKSNHYPWGAALQVNFSGPPGVFEIDIEAAEQDIDAAYVSIVTIVAVNSSNFGRAAIGFTWPKYVRGRVVTLTNDVSTTLLITR